jgi:predicted nucleic acid-binding protein
MVYKIFLDINIVVDFFVASRPGNTPAKQIFELAEFNKAKVCVSESVINTTAYLLRKDYPIEKLKTIFEEMLEIFTVIPANNETFKMAYNNKIKDMEDAVLYQLALESKMDFFISNDKSDFKNVITKRKLPVLSSLEFTKMIA